MKKYIRPDNQLSKTVEKVLLGFTDPYLKKEGRLLFNEIEKVFKAPIIVLPDRKTLVSDLAGVFDDQQLFDKKLKLGYTYLEKPFFNECVYFFTKDEIAEINNIKTNEKIMHVPTLDQNCFYFNIEKREGWLITHDRTKPNTIPSYIPFIYNPESTEGKYVVDSNKVKKFYVVFNLIEQIHQNLMSTFSMQGLNNIEGLKNPLNSASLLLETRIMALAARISTIFTEEFYAVTEKPIESKGDKTLIKFRNKTIWLKALPPTIKFIRDFSDLPVKKKEHGVVKLERRPYQKRGYWCTLKADRFSNHPLFMIFKGFYRRPAWVGPKEIEHEGNTYKIILQDEVEKSVTLDIMSEAS